MKKIILSLALITGAMSLSACSGYGSASMETSKDSISYALGIDVGNSIRKNMDSTLNYKLICKGIADVFENSGDIQWTEAQEQLRIYFTETRPKEVATENEKASLTFLAAAAKESGVEASESGLLYNIENIGEGELAAVGDTLTVHYTLSDANGNKLQSSLDNGTPMTYVNAPGAMIKGFEEGVAMLGKGGKATLFLPCEIAYGAKGGGMIGANQALKFEVEVVDVKKPIEK